MSSNDNDSNKKDNDNKSLLQPLDTSTWLDCPPLKWGILGCGRVSHDFCLALQHVPTAKVVACATRNDAQRAQAFATRHNIPIAYNNYLSLVQDPQVDIVYVGNLHNSRRPTGKLVLMHNKHVLLEKPMAVKKEDAEYLIQLAQSRHLFLMEGMWTRFFPAVIHAKQLSSACLGTIVQISSDFNFNAADSESYPDSFVYNRRLGGGASLLTGPYPIAAALLFGASQNDSNQPTVKVVGTVDEQLGVDLQAAVVLQFPNSNTLATLSYGMMGESAEITTVVGTKGRLTIQSPCHCPTQLTLVLKGDGRGQSAINHTWHYPLPPDTPSIVAAGGFVYPNSAGFCYQAAAVARCIVQDDKPQLQCEYYTHVESLQCQAILEAVRVQLQLQAADEE